jgi:hypothetical protein
LVARRDEIVASPLRGDILIVGQLARESNPGRPARSGVYLAEGKFYPLALFSLRLAAEAPKARDLEGSAGLHGAAGGSKPPCSIVGCAGAIRGLDHGLFEDFRVELAG